MLNSGNELSENNIGIKLLEVSEKSIVIKSYKYKIKGLDHDDIAQELRKKIWEVRHLYDPKRSSMNTFTSFVINNYIKDLFRASKRKKQFLNKAADLEKVSERDIKYHRTLDGSIEGDDMWNPGFSLWENDYCL